MNYYIVSALQCGAFLGIPIITFLVGYRVFIYYEPNNKWIKYLTFGLLIALIGFELSFLGLLFDPDMTEVSVISKIVSSIKFGLITPVIIVIIHFLNKPIYQFRDRFIKSWRFFSRKDGKYGGWKY